MEKLVIAILVILLLAVLIIGGIAIYSSRQRTVLDNYPYEPDTPPPPNHEGTFVSSHGTMTFNGDGETVAVEFDAYLASLLGISEGEHKGTYDFLSGNLPPHGSFPIRYDVAHEMRLVIDDNDIVIDMGLASEGGKTGSVGVNMVTPERIPMLFREDKVFDIVFEKQN